MREKCITTCITKFLMISGCIKEISKVKKYFEFPNIVDTLDNAYLKDHGEPGLREDQKAVWRNGVDTKPVWLGRGLISKAIEFRKKFNIAENDIVFLFSGRLTPEKGAEELLKAFTEVAQKFPIPSWLLPELSSLIRIS